MSTIDNPVYQPEPAVGPIAMRYGLIIGLVSSAIGLIMYLTNMTDPADGSGNTLGTILNILIMAGGIYMAQAAWKALNAGFMSYGKAFNVGFRTSLIVALITLVYSLLFFYLIAPDAINEIADAQMAQMETQGMTEEQMEAASGMMGSMSNPFVLSIMAAIGTLILGIIISAIVGLITRKDRAVTV